ncbi:MAG: membrane protein insertase YidC, partial [Bacteroidaceae bacterium]|nr:membrane protein insertase YidC [Bacteroidaceae bacterium]
MDKNTIAGFFLIALVLIGFSWWNRPSETELQEMARQDSIAQVEQQKAEKAQALQAQQAAERRQALVADSTSLFFANRGGESTDVVLENDLVKLTLSTQGATVKSAELKEYKNYKGEPVVLLDKALALDMQWATKTDNINAQDYCFSVQEQSDSSATLRLGDEQRHIDVTYTLHPATYMTDITIAAQGMQNYFAPNASSMYVNHASVVVQQEKGQSFENQYSQFTYREMNGDVNELSASGTDEEQPEEAVQWIASKNQFFSAVLISDKGFTQAKLSSATCNEGEALKAYAAEMQTKFDPKGLDATHLQLFTGPNDFHLLKEHDRLAYGNQDIELERLVYFGWPLFRWINRWIIMPLFDLLKGLGLSMGLVILLLTLIIKALVYPATHKSYMSSARMKVLKPEIDKIAAKYPKQEDALKKQQETM